MRLPEKYIDRIMVIDEDDEAVMRTAKSLNVSENWDHIRPGDYGSSLLCFRERDMFLFTVKRKEYEGEQVYQALRFVDGAEDPELIGIVNTIVGYGVPRVPRRYILN